MNHEPSSPSAGSVNFYHNTGTRVHAREPHGMAATVLEGTARKLVTRKCGEPTSKARTIGDSRKDGLRLDARQNGQTGKRGGAPVMVMRLKDQECRSGLSLISQNAPALAASPTQNSNEATDNQK